MAAPLTGPARREKALRAYTKAIQRISYTKIAEELGISRNLVSTLVSEEQERQWEGRDLSELDEEKRRSVETYESVMRVAWERLGTLADNSLNVSGLFNAIISAQSKIDDITGAKAPTKSENKHLHEHKDYANTPTEDLLELEELAQRVFGAVGE